MGSLKDISSFSILLFLFMFTYVLLGMELFANRVKYNANDKYDLTDGTSPRENFDSFWNALLTIFIVLTGENWDSIMYSFARPFGAEAVVFFVSFIIIGQMILLNLFLAILLKNFDESKVVDKIDPAAERLTFLDKLSELLKGAFERLEARLCHHSRKAERYKAPEAAPPEFTEAQQVPKEPVEEEVKFNEEETKKLQKVMSLFQKKESPLDRAKNRFLSKLHGDDANNSSRIKRKQSFANIILLKQAAMHHKSEDEVCEGSALFCLKKDNRIRMRLARLV